MTRYKIAVKTLGNAILTFTVSKYEITDGDFVEFVDEKTGQRMKFHGSNCEIREAEQHA